MRNDPSEGQPRQGQPGPVREPVRRRQALDPTQEIHSDTLNGKVVVVTGATSGIGRSIALEMARHSANVIIHGRNPELADQVLSELATLPANSIDRHAAHLADLANSSALEEFVDSAWRSAEKFSLPDAANGVDIWVNNAGADVLTGVAASQSFDERLQLLWQVDVLATIRLSRLVAERMKRRGGTIINMGWDQAESGMAGDSGEMFATIKGAVMAFTRSLARSSAPKVRANCVAPGWIKTKWGDETSEYWNERARGESLLHRWGHPDDVARVVRFLASADAEFVNGQTIHVNGGSQPWPVGWPAEDQSQADLDV